jgi:serine/threonine-protein kinase HipA
MTASQNALRVSLGGTEVGFLELDSGGIEVIRFSTTEAYRALRSRPVLSQALEDDLSQTWTSRVRAPAFFSNLLPEGVLRELLAQRAGVNPAREFFVLAELGQDLPGNVTVQPVGPLDHAGELDDELPATPVSPEEALRFSVAGLQLKFSVNPKGGGWVLPVRGAGGRWLAKLPSQRFPQVPRNEFWMMRFARAVGLTVPDVQLATADGIEGLAPVLAYETVSREPAVLLVRRFDRTQGAERLHTEDFLQVLNKHPGDKVKYNAASAEWVGRLVLALEAERIDEVVNRFVFNVIIGNGDAHLKNWMLRYEDGRRARLSPAFDLVSTIQYPDTDQHEYALNLGRSKRYVDFEVARLEAFTTRLEVPSLTFSRDLHELVAKAQAFAEQALAAWPGFEKEYEVDAGFSETLRRHWVRVPFLRPFVASR